MWVVGDQSKVDDCGDEVTYGISLLKETGNETSSGGRYILERSGCGQTLIESQMMDVRQLLGGVRLGRSCR